MVVMRSWNSSSRRIVFSVPRDSLSVVNPLISAKRTATGCRRDASPVGPDVASMSMTFGEK
jgi:hypothetical protein